MCKRSVKKIKKYSIVYADPPWRYSAKNVQGAAENHYPTMSIEELCALPVADLAAPDSALFLWATFPQLPEALRLIEAWGFTYKSVAFVWLKKNKKADSWFYCLGFWTRGNAEICLLAIKGHPKRQAANIHQFIVSPIEAHSKKPDEARDKIISLMGDLPVRVLHSLPGAEKCVTGAFSHRPSSSFNFNSNKKYDPKRERQIGIF